VRQYDPQKHHRQSIRLKGYDYSQPGAYFVTLVTHQKKCWFERLEFRAVVEQEWRGLLDRFPTIQLDEFVIMPNHVHFIIWLNPPDVPVGAQFNCAPAIGQSFTVDPERPTLGQVVRTFKAVVTRRIRQTEGEGFAWQRNYYERIVRNERELNAVRQYIRDNLFRWANDRENPDHDHQDRLR
jgi:putative transposase